MRSINRGPWTTTREHNRDIHSKFFLLYFQLICFVTYVRIESVTKKRDRNDKRKDENRTIRCAELLKRNLWVICDHVTRRILKIETTRRMQVLHNT